jgi:hypothetical protein
VQVSADLVGSVLVGSGSDGGKNIGPICPGIDCGFTSLAESALDTLYVARNRG